MVHADVCGYAQQFKDGGLACRARILRVDGALQQRSESLRQQGLSECSLLFNCVACVGMEQAREQTGCSEPFLLRRSFARLWAVSSMSDH